MQEPARIEAVGERKGFRGRGWTSREAGPLRDRLPADALGDSRLIDHCLILAMPAGGDHPARGTQAGNLDCPIAQPAEQLPAPDLREEAQPVVAEDGSRVGL